MWPKPNNSALAQPVSAFTWLIQRELMLAWRSKMDLALVPLFFVMVVSLFPLALGPDTAQLQRMGAGVIWVAALLASLLAAPRLLQADYQDGALEQLALLPLPLSLLCFGKIAAHWLLTSLPLLLITPLLALQYQLADEQWLTLLLSLLLGTPALSALVATGAALSLGVRSAAGLVAIIILPLTVPILIFGAGAVETVRSGLSAEAHLSLLAAFTLLSLLALPFAMAQAIRLVLDS
jgi:heme exporter protein B